MPLIDRRGLLLGIAFVAACASGPAAGPDAGADGAAPCGADLDCDDSRFCNGTERCRPGDPRADAAGCVSGSPPCGPNQSCSEPEHRCHDALCGVSPDADGDGHTSLACGGDDCDDADPLRFPGNVEICDAESRDEDCDPTSFGFRDLDGDGWTDAKCCNRSPSGPDHCGADCDDARAGVHPGAPEVCNGIDDDCDGSVDEGVTQLLWPDLDGDGFGDASALPRAGCYPHVNEAARGGDCDDQRGDVHPAAPERCDAAGLDENCDGVVNPPELCECITARTAPCDLGGLCAAGIRRCIDGRWSACSVTPVSESCDGRDEDCDGLVDEGVRVRCFVDTDGDSYAPAGSVPTMECPDANRPSSGGCPAGTTPREAIGDNVDCDDSDGRVRPLAPEQCNGVDDDCDGSVDEGATIECWRDADRDGFAAGGATLEPVCAAPESGGCPLGYTAIAPGSATTTDCDDTDSGAWPGAVEICNLVDDDCDGDVDEGIPLSMRFVDADGDGYGDDTMPIEACDGFGTSAQGGDCNDANASAHPAQVDYFHVPHCPTPQTCTFDYDCDGSDTREPHAGAPSTCGGGVACACIPGPCAGCSVPMLVGGECGELGTWRYCCPTCDGLSSGWLDQGSGTVRCR